MTKEPSNIVPLHLLSTTPADLIEYPKSSLANVKGLARSKAVLKKVAEDATLTNREPPLSGILMYGPPNCGKTYLCKILAGELQVAFMPISCSELADARTDGPKIVRDIEKIVERNMPCLLLFDEIDKIQEEGTVRAILNLFEKAAYSTDQLFLVAATATTPWEIRAEFVGVGNLGQILLVLPPDNPARLAMLNRYLPDLSLDDDIDVEWLAQHTDGYTATDLQRMCENAYDVSRAENRPSPNMSDLKAAFNNYRPASGAWLDRAAHQAMLSKHTGLYEDLLDYLNARHK